MVAQITEGTAFDKHGRPFRPRNPRPAIIVVILLVVLTGVVWTVALTRPPDITEAAVCNPPPQPADATATVKLGERVSRTEMTDVTPAQLGETKVRVLNASGRGGQAADVAGALKDLGFTQPTAANDPVYADTRLDCQGRSDSASPDKRPRRRYGWSHRAPNCSTTAGPTTPSTSSWAPTSPPWRTTTTLTRC